MHMYCPQCEAKNEDSATRCKNCGHEMKNSSSRQPGSSTYAGFEKRFIAHVIDVAVVSFITGIVGIIMIILVSITPIYRTDSSEIITLLFCAIGFIIPILYYADMESSLSQATFGKQAMGIIVTDMEGNRISFEKAVKREVCKVITVFFFYIGYLAIIFSEKKQGLYDMMVETVVIYD